MNDQDHRLTDEQIDKLWHTSPLNTSHNDIRIIANAAADYSYEVGLAQGYANGLSDGHDEGEIAAWAEANELGKVARAEAVEAARGIHAYVNWFARQGDETAKRVVDDWDNFLKSN